MAIWAELLASFQPRARLRAFGHLVSAPVSLLHVTEPHGSAASGQHHRAARRCIGCHRHRVGSTWCSRAMMRGGSRGGSAHSALPHGGRGGGGCWPAPLRYRRALPVGRVLALGIRRSASCSSCGWPGGHCRAASCWLMLAVAQSNRPGDLLFFGELGEAASARRADLAAGASSTPRRAHATGCAPGRCRRLSSICRGRIEPGASYDRPPRARLRPQHARLIDGR